MDPSPRPTTVPTSTFSFIAPFPTTAPKQRRVSLALPSAPRQVPPWTFRDDTVLDGRTSEPVEERRGKMRRLTSDDPPEKKTRKKWTMEETQMLVDGCNKHGVGNWKAILQDPTLAFDSRSPVDLKDRFRTYFPDAYKQHYPNAKTHLSSKVRSALPDGSSIFEKTRSKKRRPFTAEEDRALKAGYDKHGTVWATIVKDPVFQEQNRRSTDLRDRFRNAFPELYQAAGYKPRAAAAKKKSTGILRAVTDEHLSSARETGPARRKRRHTTQGFLRGGTKSVPLSPSGSDEDESSADEDEDAPCPKLSPPEVDMQLADDAHFLPSASQSLSDVTDSWSGLDTPMRSSSATWSTSNAAGSPTSSHDLLFSSDAAPVRHPTMIGKSAWGPSDWLSANPRLDSSSPPYYAGGGGFHEPLSPFAFAHLAHGVLDRYDLFPASIPHDFASEAGLGDSSHSAFSDPDMLAFSAFRGFTHHSNTAGDLIFGARTHQPQPDYGPGFGFGLGAHTPALPGIDEIALSAITLNDPPPPGPPGPEPNLKIEPLGTPVRAATAAARVHNRSLSVPPPEHRFLPRDADSHPPQAPLTPTRSLSLDVHSAGMNADLHAFLGGGGFSMADMIDLPFLDLHYYGNGAGAGTGGMGEEEAQAHLEGARHGLALDLAADAFGVVQLAAPAMGMRTGRAERAGGSGHQRGQSAVSPQDLEMRRTGDTNKRKRASWDGGPR